MATRGVNKVILVGYLGQDPEVRYLPSGGAVANFTLATSETWRDKQDGQMRENTEWHRVVVFGKLAEVAGEYLRKGAQVYIEGQLRSRKWTDQSGLEKYVTEVVVNVGGTMQMLGGRRESQPQSDPQTPPPAATVPAAPLSPCRRRTAVTLRGNAVSRRRDSPLQRVPAQSCPGAFHPFKSLSPGLRQAQLVLLSRGRQGLSQ